MGKPKIGLLPMYIALYDDIAPECRQRVDSFPRTIAGEFEKRGLDVVAASVCTVEPEFVQAVNSFEDEHVDAIVTLHLAYSPSLESADALSATKLPIIVLDTTPTFGFGPGQDPAEIMFNHGIHGVQDLCNVLIRRGKDFHIEAGHWEKSDVLDRVACWARAAQAGSAIRNSRIGRIGESFQGMGDFAVPEDVLWSTIGIDVVPIDPAGLRFLMPSDDDQVVRAEIALDGKRFSGTPEAEAHMVATRTCLAVRRWIERENLTGFTMNFLAIDSSSGLVTPPFLEASKAMARGLGYAGEGDVLTAALVGALASTYGQTTFTEMFCPDWENGAIFLSHMGEVNDDLLEKAELVKKPFPFTDAADPVMAVGRLRGGEAVFVDLAPGPEDTYTLIVAKVEMIGSDGEDRMGETIRGWFRPQSDIADFLADYSLLGGTHHAALVYGDRLDDMAHLAEIMGWDLAVL